MSEDNDLSPLLLNGAADNSMYVLCGCGADGALIEKMPHVHPPRFRGLLWGIGAPDLANLNFEEWCVARISRCAEVTDGNLKAVEFEEYELVSRGDPFVMIETIVSLGANPDAFSFQIESGDEESMGVVGQWGLVRVAGNGIARSGGFGRARTGANGIAQVGHTGFAQTEAYGVAVADEMGTARAGDYGLAVSDGKRFGEATAGDGGIAVGRGRYKVISAGEFGIAISQGSGRATAGANGIAICWTDVAHAGADGMAVGTTVSGDLGAFLVATYQDHRTGMRGHAVGRVGCDGLQPFEAYVCMDGKLTPAEAALDRDVIV